MLGESQEAAERGEEEVLAGCSVVKVGLAMAVNPHHQLKTMNCG